MDLTPAFIVGQSIYLAIFIAVIWTLWPWKKKPRKPAPVNGYSGPRTMEAINQAQFELTLATLTTPTDRDAYRNALLTAIQCGMTPQNIKTMATQHLTGKNHNEPQRT